MSFVNVISFEEDKVAHVEREHENNNCCNDRVENKSVSGREQSPGLSALADQDVPFQGNAQSEEALGPVRNPSQRQSTQLIPFQNVERGAVYIFCKALE